ncbi:hypothetical protein FALBO_639 [Fusarium albosuccineum]|uniref:RRM domain-containing protein n=1 Tax=Fusarium albosuccineum TaxID=1237068 RepID=A0A8H4LNC2_9HYPO|nr:hypothetical protein FALBO_639 [Fusarium albosuccineum]
MTSPKTPDTQTQSSSPLVNTPNSQLHSTPPTDPRGITEADIDRFNKGGIPEADFDRYNRELAQIIRDSPSFRTLNPWYPIAAMTELDNSPGPARDQGNRNTRISGGSGSSGETVVPRSQPSISFDMYASAQVPHVEPSGLLRFGNFSLQSPAPNAPIRQPTAPPASSFESNRNAFNGNRNLDGLSPNPSIWQGPNSRFSRLHLDAQSPTTPGTPFRQLAESPQLPQLHGMNLSQNLNNERLSSLIPSTPPGFASIPQPISPTRGFRPMAAITQNQRSSVDRTEREITPADPTIFSGNYRGEHSIRNASVEALAPEENCALWLTNLPPDVTHQQLLAQIRNVGRIWCTVINAPDYSRHNTAAAKVVFFTPQSAQILLSKSLTRGLEVNGYRVKVTHNRVKYREEPPLGNATRVLIITGKSTFVNRETLTEFFKERFVFEVDEIIELIVQGQAHTGGRSVIEYKFGSFRCQAQMGKMALEKDRPEGFEKVEFGPDPCEVGDTLSSYGIAAERIQGRGI